MLLPRGKGGEPGVIRVRGRQPGQQPGDGIDAVVGGGLGRGGQRREKSEDVFGVRVEIRRKF